MQLDGFLEFLNESDYAEASINTNPYFKWVKFILTDSKPNKNNQRIPEEEFDNLIKTGVYAPFKMSRGQINDGHDFAEPIGVISKLIQSEDKILGLATLWPRERKDDIDYLESLHRSGSKLNVSWEILYEDSFVDENGVENLKGVSLVGATIVGLPAYAGRTPVIAVASDNNEEVKTMDERIEDEVQKTEEETVPKKDYDELQGLYQKLSSEYTQLKDQYAQLEALYASELRLKQIKQKFAAYGINKPEQYFEENRDRLLSLSDDALEFMLQEMVAGLPVKESGASVNLPPIAQPSQVITKDKILEYLRKQISK